MRGYEKIPHLTAFLADPARKETLEKAIMAIRAVFPDADVYVATMNNKTQRCFISVGKKELTGARGQCVFRFRPALNQKSKTNELKLTLNTRNKSLHKNFVKEIKSALQQESGRILLPLTDDKAFKRFLKKMSEIEYVKKLLSGKGREPDDYLLQAGPPSLEDVVRCFEEAVERSRKSESEERKERLERADKKPEKKEVTTMVFVRNPDVVAEVLHRANGKCGKCPGKAPFNRASTGEPYLEVHHVIPLAYGGDDTVENAIALCPNCHRFMHYG
jgi:hypothetical protein